MARLGEVPFARYYGSVDSTPLFVMLAGLYLERTGDLKTISDLWPHIEVALDWIDSNAAHSKHRFVTYRRSGGTGLANQGWKDLPIPCSMPTGRTPPAPSRSVRSRATSMPPSATRRRSQRRSALRRAPGTCSTRPIISAPVSSSAFWCEDLGTYAMALDGRNRPCRVRSSNAGQLLFSGMIPTDRAAQVADQLLNQAFFTGWGIRTIGGGETRFNPMSYHNGSVWPHDNALIGLGLARYGMKAHLLKLFSGIFSAGAYMDLRRLPELFCGFKRVAGKGPTFYPVACSPQAWASATPFALLQACIGLELDFAADTVRFRQPRLPAFLDEVVICSLALGGSRLDILLRRYDSDVSVNVLRRVGDAQVEVHV